MYILLTEVLYVGQAACIILAGLSLDILLMGLGSYQKLRIGELRKDKALLCLLAAFGTFLVAFALCTVLKWLCSLSAPSAMKELALLAIICAGALCILMGNMLLSTKRERRAS